MNTITTKKQLARSAALAARQAMQPELKAEKSSRVCGQLNEILDMHLQGGRDIRTVSVYSAMAKELDLTAFIRHAYQCGLRVVFPCMNRTEVRSERMDMRQVTREAFECGRAPFVSSPAEAFERNEPLLSVFPVVHPQDVDMVVVPLVAYDRRNKRLGYGAGNYDGFLAGIRPDAVVVGAAFTEQLVDEVPCEPHDVPLPHIATA